MKLLLKKKKKTGRFLNVIKSASFAYTSVDKKGCICGKLWLQKMTFFFEIRKRVNKEHVNKIFIFALHGIKTFCDSCAFHAVQTPNLSSEKK